MSSPSIKQAPGFYRYKVGSFTAVSLHDGTVAFPFPAGFVRNASDEAVGAAYAEAGMPSDKLTLTFNPLLIDTGRELVLIDTGFGAGGPPGTGQTVANLQAAGVQPDQVGLVILSHFHTDHLLGLRKADGSPTYPNATIAVPAPEVAFWTDDAAVAAGPDALKPHMEAARAMLKAAGDKLHQFNWGDEIRPGLKAVDVHGHTPGMTAIEISSGGETLTYVADVTNTPVVFARHPDWQVAFDLDADTATATRKRVFDKAASDRSRLHFYHAPFPASGTIAKNGAGYEYIPSIWRAE